MEPRDKAAGGSRKHRGPELDTGTTGWYDRIQGSIARSRKVKGGNYVQLATVDAQGDPACRTVVFRGFHQADGLNLLKMITDRRSQKVEHCRASPRAELVWWFGKSSEQYRIKGDLVLVGADCADAALLAARKQQWGNLSDPARDQFFWAQPGVGYTPPAGPDGAANPTGGRDADGRLLPMPDDFLLVLLRPSSVKYLRLSDNFAQQDDSAGGGWEARRVNP